jgi:hypothetical protein
MLVDLWTIPLSPSGEVKDPPGAGSDPQILLKTPFLLFTLHGLAPCWRSLSRTRLLVGVAQMVRDEQARQRNQGSR